MEERSVGDGVEVELIELGKNLMVAARNNDVKAVVELMRYGAPFATDWVRGFSV